MKDTQHPARLGRPSDPGKRQRILDALSGDPCEFFEIGTPPYPVAGIAERLQMDPSNLRKALLQMEQERLVLSERRKVAVWNAIAQDHQDRVCLCYWNVATQDQDKQDRDAWNAGSKELSRAAFDRMVAVRSTAAK